jgi:hypothetical protein
MVEKLTSRKLAALLAGLLAEVGLVAIDAFQGGITEGALERAQIAVGLLTAAAIGAQSAIDFIQGKIGGGQR